MSIVARAKHGDKAAFTSLVAAHGRDVLRLCTVMLRDHDAAQDAAQATWAQAWQHLGSLRHEEHVRAWLLRIAANESRQLIRRSNRERRGLGFFSESEPHHTVGDSILDLRDAIGRLDASDRELLAYRYALGLTASEISLTMKLSPEGVRSRLKRLRDRLRKELANE